jgi:GDP-L-fucose synthase
VRILITGAAGMLGRSLVDQARSQRPDDDVVAVTRADVDLLDQAATRSLIEREAPDAIIHAAARVNGIAAKLAEPTTYLLENLVLDANVIKAAIGIRVPELIYVGTAAVYPAEYERPFVEADVLTGALEGANEGYALSKIAALKVCEYASRQYDLDYRAVLPSNLYGVHDHFDLSSAHLVAATLAKVHAAKRQGASSVSVWGDGTARREFTFAGDAAEWLVSQLGALAAWPPALNLGVGTDHSVAEYYEVAKEVVGFDGTLEFDTSKPSGVPRRLIDSSVARSLGWDPRTSLRDGMAATYADYLTTEYAQKD